MVAAPTGRGRRQASASAAAGAPLLLVVASILVAVNYGRLHELVPALEHLPVGKLLLPLGVIALIMRSDVAERMRFLRTPQGKGFCLFLVAIVVAIPTSLWVGGALRESIDFAKSTVPFFVIVSAAILSERDLRWIMRSVVLATIVVGLVLAVGAGFSTGGRMFVSTTYDPNDVALAAVVAFPLAMGMLREPRPLWRLVGISGMAMALLIVPLTGSRGATVALAVVLTAVFFFYRRSLSMKWKLLAVPLLAVALAAAPAMFWERVETLTDLSEDYNFTSSVGRVELWKRGLGYFGAHPITGVGFAQYAVAEGRWAAGAIPEGLGFKWSTAHNTVLQVAVELGTVGLIGFLAIFIPTIRAWRRFRARPHGRTSTEAMVALGETLELAILGFFAGGFFLSAAYGPIALSLATLSVGYGHLVLLHGGPAGSGSAGSITNGAGRRGVSPSRGASAAASRLPRRVRGSRRDERDRSPRFPRPMKTTQE